MSNFEDKVERKIDQVNGNVLEEYGWRDRALPIASWYGISPFDHG